MSGLIAEIVSIILAAFFGALTVITLQRQGRVKHRLRAMLGIMFAVLAISLIVSRFILGRLDGATLLVDVPVIVVGAVLFRTAIYGRQQISDNDESEKDR
jgi:uncharacterized membrane protein YwzB